MGAADLAVVSRRVVTPDGEQPAAVIIRDGRVADVVEPSRAPAGAHDVGETAVLPGLVDSHVHINEPGRTHWEGFATATRAAAAGGITTLVDMPLNCLPPTTTAAALAAKQTAARTQIHVDVAFWGGVVPGSEPHLRALHDAGVCGFKAFLCDSGVEEYGWFDAGAVPALLEQTADLGTTLLVHAEDAAVLKEAVAGLPADADPRRYATYLSTRPPAAEHVAVTAVVEASRRTGGRAHLLHVSAGEAAAAVADARREGVAVTAETCPHYLTLAAEDVPDGATAFKCAPPVRERANQAQLWQALADGTFDAVVSDHSPCPPEDKQPHSGDFLAAWGGIASLQLALPLVWTEARARGHGLTDIARWMSAGPAHLAGLPGKGAILPGADADLVLFDPDETWHVEVSGLHHRHPVTPYAGREVTGRVQATLLRGRPVVWEGELYGPPAGQLRRRGEP